MNKITRNGNWNGTPIVENEKRIRSSVPTPDEIAEMQRQCDAECKPWTDRLKWLIEHRIPTMCVRKEPDGSITFIPVMTPEMKSIQQIINDIHQIYFHKLNNE